jgi:hypothetical protein
MAGAPQLGGLNMGWLRVLAHYSWIRSGGPGPDSPSAVYIVHIECKVCVKKYGDDVTSTHLYLQI